MHDEFDGGRKLGQGLAGSGEQSEFHLSFAIAQVSNQARFQPADQTVTARPGLHGDTPARGVVPARGGHGECPNSQFANIFRASDGRGDNAGCFSGALPPTFSSEAETLAYVFGKTQRGCTSILLRRMARATDFPRLVGRATSTKTGSRQMAWPDVMQRQKEAASRISGDSSAFGVSTPGSGSP